MRDVYFILFAITFILTEIGRKIYRPYVYQTESLILDLRM